MKRYENHDARKLGKFYTDHVLAMTSEQLHSKADIAIQLAYRDKKIKSMQAEIDEGIGAIKIVSRALTNAKAEIDLLKAQNRAIESDAVEARMVLRRASKKLKEMGVDFL